METLSDRIKRHEGLRLITYTDSTGNLTIGYGHNMATGITIATANQMLTDDIRAAEAFVDKHFQWAETIDLVRRQVFIELAFQLGRRLLGFPRALIAAEQGHWETCADELLDSVWARQCPERALELVAIIRAGQL